MIGGLCIGYVAGVVTMVLLFVVGGRFRSMEARRTDRKDYEQIEAIYKKWCEGTLADRDF